jgi:nuclear-control-of-ATPase protein 2
LVHHEVGKLQAFSARKTNIFILFSRRIERLLISQPKSSYNSHPPRLMSTSDGIPSLTSGLLLLSLTHLRAYAESSLPAYSLLREGFLDDVANLEDPSLGRAEKMRIVDRMWKSWGQVLGWGGIAGEMSGR